MPPFAIWAEPRGNKKFFPQSQLFGFTGTPIFEENASQKQIEGDVQTLKTTLDLFQKELHDYTITNAIEDRNVLRFHIDYFQPEGKELPKGSKVLSKKAVVDAILEKHNAQNQHPLFQNEKYFHFGY